MQQGFIQIPILIAIIISAAVFGGGGYFVAKQIIQAPQVATTTAEQIVSSANEEIIVEQKTLKEETVEEENKVPKIQTQVKIETPIVKEEVVAPVAKNFKQPVLESINAQINSYKALANWIDNEMMSLLSQRESMLNGLISSTNSLMASETDPSVKYAYSLFIDAYNLDKTQIVNFYRWDIFDFIKQYINNEKLPGLNSEYAKYSAKSTVSEVEYNTVIQSLQQYESDWQSLYNDGIKKSMVQYMSQTDSKDEMYQRLWSELSIAVADLKKTQALESSLNQLYLQQPKPLNCTFSSYYNGFGTTGSLNCY